MHLMGPKTEAKPFPRGSALELDGSSGSSLVEKELSPSLDLALRSYMKESGLIAPDLLISKIFFKTQLMGLGDCWRRICQM